MRNFIIRLISLFIFPRNKRKEFRDKYIKINPIWIVRDELKQYINNRIVEVANTLLDTRTIPQAKGYLRKLQEAQNILLIKLAEILEKNNIDYWIDYGTLLGAYRHNGFIPWDDDIDIGMMRNDFEKLKEVISKQDTFELIECLHLKYSQTCLVNKFCIKDKHMNCHFAADIFVYDYQECEDMDSYYDKYVIDKQNMHDELKSTNIVYEYEVCKNEKDLSVLNSIFNKYRNIYKSKADGNTILYGIENVYDPARRIHRKETIFPLKKIEFEGVQYFAPNNIEKYLSVSFYNFMKLPSDFGIPKHYNYTYEQIEEMTELAKNL